MEQEQTPTPAAGAPETAGDAVLRYLAATHPDDEDSLEKMTRLLEAGSGSADLLDTLYRGLHADEAAEEAAKTGYLRGRNEAVEMKRKESFAAFPSDDGGEPDDNGIPLLRNIRRSVWD